VYRVSGSRVIAGVSMSWAIEPVTSRATVPVGLVQGAEQVSVKVASPDSGAIGALKAAETMAMLVGTWSLSSSGVTLVTVGARAAPPSDPRTESRPPEQPDANAPNATTVQHSRYLEDRPDVSIAHASTPSAVRNSVRERTYRHDSYGSHCALSHRARTSLNRPPHGGRSCLDGTQRYAITRARWDC
jgi:hypothetical protein